MKQFTSLMAWMIAKARRTSENERAIAENGRVVWIKWRLLRSDCSDSCGVPSIVFCSCLSSGAVNNDVIRERFPFVCNVWKRHSDPKRKELVHEIDRSVQNEGNAVAAAATANPLESIVHRQELRWKRWNLWSTYATRKQSFKQFTNQWLLKASPNHFDSVIFDKNFRTQRSFCCANEYSKAPHCFR